MKGTFKQKSRCDFISKMVENREVKPIVDLVYTLKMVQTHINIFQLEEHKEK